MIVHNDRKDPIPVVESENAQSRQQTTTSAQDVINYVSDKKEEIKAHVTDNRQSTESLLRTHHSENMDFLRAMQHEEMKRKLDRAFVGAEWAGQLLSRSGGNFDTEPFNFKNDYIRGGFAGTFWFNDHDRAGQWITLREINNYPGKFFNVICPPSWDYNDGTSPDVYIRVKMDGYTRIVSYKGLREGRCLVMGDFSQPYHLTDREDYFSGLGIGEASQEHRGIPFLWQCKVEIKHNKPMTTEQNADGYYGLCQVTYSKDTY